MRRERSPYVSATRILDGMDRQERKLFLAGLDWAVASWLDDLIPLRYPDEPSQTMNQVISRRYVARAPDC
jgi:hypothetical protein